jgi:cytochrome c biogenesis protein CcdA
LQIVSAILGGITLLVLALLFCGGAVVSILHDFRSILSWILSIVFAVMGLAFGFGGATEIHRGITQHLRR